MALTPLLAVGMVAALAAHLLKHDMAARPAVTVSDARGFALVDHQGRAVTERDFRGRLMLVYFGFTACPDLCPTALADMGLALDSLGERAREVAFLFVTVDPGRDTPETLAGYVGLVHPQLMGLSGGEAACAAAARSFGVTVERSPGKEPGADKLQHSTSAYLLDRESRLITTFAHGTPPERIAAELRQHL